MHLGWGHDLNSLTAEWESLLTSAGDSLAKATRPNLCRSLPISSLKLFSSFIASLFLKVHLIHGDGL